MFILETNITTSVPDAGIPPALSAAIAAMRPGETNLAAAPHPWSTWDEFRANSPAVQRELMDLATKPMPDLRNTGRQRLPSNAPDDVNKLGELVGSIMVPGENRDVIVLISTLLILGGIGFAFVMTYFFFFEPPRNRPGPQSGKDIIAFVFVLVLCFGAVAFGTWCGFYRPQWLPTSVWVFENGILSLRAKAFQICPWQEIENFRISHATGRPIFWITLKDGRDVTISAGFSKDVAPLADYIEIKISAIQFLSRIRRIVEGEDIAFGKLTLNRDGITLMGDYAPWRTIKRVSSDRQAVFIDLHRMPWHQVRYVDVAFPQLVQSISLVLIDEHACLPAVPA